MANYIQTTLMPLPKQNLSDKEWYGRGRECKRRDANKRNQEINSILAFFKR